MIYSLLLFAVFLCRLLISLGISSVTQYFWNKEQWEVYRPSATFHTQAVLL